MIVKKPLVRPVFIGFFLAVLTLIAGLVSPVAGATDNTANNRAAFQAFTDAPSKASKHALQQYFSEQESHPIEDWTPEFEQLILDGHPLALEVAFESIPYTDGATSLHLDGLIGKTILSAPEAFLWGVTKYRSTIVRMDVLVGYLGSDYVDDLAGSIRGAEDRYFSLRNVESQDYNEARNEALLLLSEKIYRNRKLLKKHGSSLRPIDEGE